MMRTAKFDCFALGRKLISPLQDITNSTKKTSFTEFMISREKFEIYDHKNVNKIYNYRCAEQTFKFSDHKFLNPNL